MSEMSIFLMMFLFACLLSVKQFSLWKTANKKIFKDKWTELKTIIEKYNDRKVLIETYLSLEGFSHWQIFHFLTILERKGFISVKENTVSIKKELPSQLEI